MKGFILLIVGCLLLTPVILVPLEAPAKMRVHPIKGIKLHTFKPVKRTNVIIDVHESIGEVYQRAQYIPVSEDVRFSITLKETVNLGISF